MQEQGEVPEKKDATVVAPKDEKFKVQKLEPIVPTVRNPVITLPKGRKLPENVQLPVYYALAANGIFAISETNWFKSITRVTDLGPGYERLEDGYEITKPPMSPEFVKKIWTLFRLVYHKCQAEVVVFLYFNIEKGEYDYYVPHQRVTGTSTENLEGDYPSLPNAVYLGTIHSHASMNAFFSATDDRDDFGVDGLHIVLGKMDNDERFDIAVSIINRGKRIKFTSQQIIDVMSGLKHYIRVKKEQIVIETTQEVQSTDVKTEEIKMVEVIPNQEISDAKTETIVVIESQKNVSETIGKPVLAENKDILIQESINPIKIDDTKIVSEIVDKTVFVEELTGVDSDLKAEKHKKKDKKNESKVIVGSSKEQTIELLPENPFWVRWSQPISAELAIKQGYLWVKFNVISNTKKVHPTQRFDQRYAWVEVSNFNLSNRGGRKDGIWMERHDDPSVLEFNLIHTFKDTLKNFFNKFAFGGGYYLYEVIDSREMRPTLQKPIQTTQIPISKPMQTPLVDLSDNSFYKQLYTFIDDTPLSKESLLKIQEELKRVQGVAWSAWNWWGGGDKDKVRAVEKVENVQVPDEFDKKKENPVSENEEKKNDEKTKNVNNVESGISLDISTQSNV